MDLKLYCSWCEEHAFKVDRDTVSAAGVLILTCPRCGCDTRLSIQASGQLLVLQGENRMGSPAGAPEQPPLQHNVSFHTGPASQTASATMLASETAGGDYSTEASAHTSVATGQARRWVIDPNEIPWYDKPNALQLLDQRRVKEKISDADYDLLHRWATDGYCVVSGVIPERVIDSMMDDFDNLWTASLPFDGLTFFDLPLGPDGSRINVSHAELLKVDPTRRLEARAIPNWRINHFDAYSPAAKAIFDNPELIRLTSLIFDRPSVPDSTLSFMYGSSQDAHQDTAVFHIFPPNFIIGAWIACEDISPDCGPLMYYPESHLEPIFEKYHNYPQTNMRTADAQGVNEYRDYMSELTQKYDRHLFIAKKGEILLWHGMLLHGGAEINNAKLTRKSYVIHYVPPGMNVGNDIVGPFNW